LANEQSKPLVVLVDDSADVHRLIKARLRSEPYELTAFGNGSEALDAFKQRVPSLVLLDLDMPGMDGFAVIRAIKATPAMASTPIIILSGLSDAQDKVAAFDLGATDYVTKPFDFSELRARIRSALRIEHLLRLLAERAEVDGLTGLANRAAFNRRWTQEASEAQRYGRKLSLAVLDIDHFKRINDTFGHPAGDEVIQGFANVITASIRDCDIACRYGGEEFCIIMPETGADDAAVVGERVRAAMSKSVWPKHPEHTVTCSIGIAGTSVATAAPSAQDWLARADKALYAAKQGGRNRVMIDHLDASVPTLRMAS
jgi:diguanylate cyclase (GGDEF)-like protein